MFKRNLLSVTDYRRLVEAASLHAREREHTVSALVKVDTRVTLASVGLFVVEGMDSGRRTFLLHHPGAGEDNFAAVRGSALSPPSTFPLLSPVDDASRVDDFLRPDIDWTIKYLASDQPRSPTFTASRRLAQTSEWRILRHAVAQKIRTIVLFHPDSIASGYFTR